MQFMNELLHFSILLAAALLAARWLLRRLRLSTAKHRSLTGHSRMAKRLARLVPLHEFGYDDFFHADGAPTAVATRRREGFQALAEKFAARSPQSIAMLQRLGPSVSDLRFTGRYHVPYPFSRLARERLTSGIAARSSAGPRITDIDGNEFIDLSGAYGVNVFGMDFYKDCIAEGSRRVQELGPVLGPYHPLIESNVERIKRISGLDQVSFHMSGTEAVMQAVRLARYHTGRSHIVRFCGAYHGWWDDVQPGIGNPSAPGKVYTLAEMSEATLRVLRTRRNIACVLVNPLQAMHPNSGPPADGALMTGKREIRFDRAAYTEWLQKLQKTCNKAGIILILDDIFAGFRIAAGGAQEYFRIRADLVTYGKTLGGGLPVGVLCGRDRLMQRYREDRPLDICFARGTFNSHPYVMAAMSAFLDRFESSPVRQCYAGLEQRWQTRAEALDTALTDAGLPLRVGHFSSIFSMLYTQPSRYHWMLQFYLNAAGLLLPWVGTGRMIFSIDFPEAEFREATRRIIAAGRMMQDDGWWWSEPSITHKQLARRVLLETISARLPWLPGRGPQARPSPGGS